ncbi:MAG: hypothetical protein ACYCV4_02065 [Dermatophilaceae bacterium]
MSAASVRAAIVNYLTPGVVPFLGSVYAAVPKWIEADAYGIQGNDLSGAYMVIHIAEEAEARVSFGGATSGIKTVTYQVGLIIHFKSLAQEGSFTVAPDAWVADWDTLVDGLRTRIRASRTLGTTDGSVWQAGEGKTDLKLTVDLPIEEDGAILLWAVLDLEVVEQVIT